jgi:hypothetical protein
LPKPENLIPIPMLIRDIRSCTRAGDACLLGKLLHPRHEENVAKHVSR